MSGKDSTRLSYIDSKSNDRIRAVQNRLFIIRLCLLVALCALAAGLGASSYFILSSGERKILSSKLDDVGKQFKRNFDTGIKKNFKAAEIMNQYYNSEIKLAGTGSPSNVTFPPNVTLTGYDALMTTIVELADLRAIAFAPLVTSKNRYGFEKYAKTNVNKLGGPIGLNQRPIGCTTSACHWIVSDGIYYLENGRKKPVPNSISDSEFPDIHFPLWHIAPLKPNYKAIMIDIHASTGPRKVTAEKLLKTKKGAFTDILQLVQDNNLPSRPSSMFFSPITSNEPGNPIVGMYLGSFSFDDLLRNAIFEKDKSIQCVITSPFNTQFTLEFENGEVSVVGKGDLHDLKYSEFRRSIQTQSPAEFQIDIYPTKSYVASHLTSIPSMACLTVVLSVAFTGFLFLIYMVVERRFQFQLMQESKENFAAVVARDILLNEKKVYVRYISHEVNYGK